VDISSDQPDNVVMKTIGAAKFKEQCLAILDDLDEEGIVITKRGKPVAKVTPIRPDPRQFIGAIPGLIVDPEDDLLSTGRVWEAELPDDPEERAQFIADREAMASRPRDNRFGA
jgi:prevent-host-death family protein